MKIVPSDDLKKHLLEQNIVTPEGGFDVPDVEYDAEKALIAASHVLESAEQFEERLRYRLIWKLFGVPANGSQKGVDLTSIQRIEAMRREVAEVVEKHLPNVSADISKAMNLGHTKVVDALSDLKTFEGESHAEMLRVKTEFHDSILTLAQRAWKFAAGALGAVIVLLAVMAVFAVSAHCQLDGLKVSQAGVKQGQFSAGYPNLNFTGTVTVSCVNLVCTVNVAGGSVTNNPGGSANQLQFNSAGTAFGGVSNGSANMALVSAGSATLPSFQFLPSTKLADFSTTAATVSGKIPIYDSTAPNAAGGTGAYVPGDPFVQGTQAAGSVTQPNPVLGAVWDGTNLRALLGDSSGRQTVNINGTVPVSAASLPLPSNAAQETGGNLAAIKTDADKIPSQGQALAAASMPVVLPAAQITTLTPPAVITNFANETGGNLAAIKTDVDKIPALGQALAAASVPVVLTAAQIATLTPLSTQPISAVSLPLPTGAALDASLTTIDTDLKANVTLHAGANLIGKAGFDPTTPGTTNGVSMYSAALQTGNITTNATSIPVTTAGYSIATVTVHGTYAGVTYVFEFSDDAGTTYYPTTCTRTDTNAQVNGDGPLTNTNRAYDCSVYAASNFRVRSTAFTSGSAVVGITLSAAPIEAAPTVAVAGTVPVSLASAPTTAVTNQGLTDLDATVGAVGSAIPANAMPIGGTDGTNLVRYYVDPCLRGAHTTQLVSLTASATLITGTAAKNVYICDINIVSASADNVALVEGTGTVCATGIAGMAGGTTAATGWNFAANGGLTLGNGAASILNTDTTADNVCILVSGATQVSGSFHYVKSP